MAAEGIDESSGALLRSLITKDLGPRERVLLEEAARIADRLDALDRIVARRGVMGALRVLDVFDDETGDGREITVKVVVTDAVDAARRLATTLRSILATLGVDKIAAPAAEGGGSILDELAKRRAEREAGAAAVHASAVD